jgi:hypothetical protein
MLFDRFPQLRLALRTENAVVSLSLNDADIAIRLVRPQGGSLMSKRLKPPGIGLFGHKALLDADDEPDWGTVPIIGQSIFRRSGYRFFERKCGKS